jgi:tRNA-2-methylthio-N6-dimethylallyladenosine synthase
MAGTYHIWTIGCQMNEADSRRLAQQLEFVGYRPVANPEAADLVVMNTCVVRQQSEDRATGRLTTLARVKQEERPGMIIGLMGCMVGMKEAEGLRRRFPYVDVFMPPSETAPLLDLLQDRGLFDDVREEDGRERALREAVQDEDLPLPAEERGRSVLADVPVVLGCSHACTFCVIPYRRGAERSRPRAEILREVDSLARQGVREVMLLGQIIDRYGIDFADGTDLSALLRDVACVDGIERIRFMTSHPNYMTDALLETVAAEPKVCPHIEVAVQSGSDAVLDRMRRGYTADQYRALVARIRSHIPGAAIHTDVIVGFAGETEAEFQESVALIRELRHDKVHISRYSERPKTIAARRLPDDIPLEVKERRWHELDEAQVAILDEQNRALRGRTVQVLVEGRQKGRWRGRTRHGKLVFFDDPAERLGQLVDVEIDWTGPFTVIGRPAAAVSR